MSLLLKNCCLAGKEGMWNILITDRKIKEVGQEIVTVEKVIDAEGRLALPGIIDPHVHFRDFEQQHKEDFLTGSRAAAAGGITTVLAMPNTQPVIDSAEMLERAREAAKKSIVNYGFHYAGTKENAETLDKIKGVASVKLFMNISTGKLMIEEDEALRKIFDMSKMLSIHAEGAMVEKAIKMHSSTKNKLYICHVSAKSEIEYIKKNKKGVYVEVTPHHLFLTEEDAKKLGAFGEMNPCLKTKEDAEALWKAIDRGIVDTIGSDHAPHTTEEKNGEKPPSWVTGVETLLPLMLDAVNKGKLKIEKVIELCCENPAKIFKLRNKGKLEEGYDADITIVDMGLEKEVKNEELQTKAKWSPLNGWKLKGWPVMTFVNGNLVFDNGKINEEFRGKEVVYDRKGEIKKEEGAEAQAGDDGGAAEGDGRGAEGEGACEEGGALGESAEEYEAAEEKSTAEEKRCG